MNIFSTTPFWIAHAVAPWTFAKAERRFSQLAYLMPSVNRNAAAIQMKWFFSFLVFRFPARSLANVSFTETAKYVINAVFFEYWVQFVVTR